MKFAHVIALTSLAAMSLHAVDVISPKSEAEIDALIKDRKLVILKFEAEWCGPCQMSKTPFKETAAATSNSDVAFVLVDIDKFEPLSKRFEVTSIPTLVYIVNGQVADREAGMASVSDFKANIRSKIAKHLEGATARVEEVAARVSEETKEEAEKAVAASESFLAKAFGAITGILMGIFNTIKGLFETIFDKIRNIF